MTNATIQLQSVGKVPAVNAGTLVNGDLLMWNFGSVYKVLEVLTEKETKAFITISTQGCDIHGNLKGQVYEQRLKKDRLVARLEADHFEKATAFANRIKAAMNK